MSGLEIVQTRGMISILVMVLGAGCWGGSRGGESDFLPGPDRPSSVPGPSLFDPTALYQRAGLIAHGDPLPFAGSIHYLAGPVPETTLVVLSLSFANRALTFAP